MYVRSWGFREVIENDLKNIYVHFGASRTRCGEIKIGVVDWTRAKMRKYDLPGGHCYPPLGRKYGVLPLGLARVNSKKRRNLPP